ncbi:hypothetical protein, conserved [Eimeria brunetti]|uniref:Uncharacterized protein n=1 Tax=Eimeria brunetti TaxID=51314 RepID=U6LJG1_9EIME|nr:hypothetical protein, conserved [Eimeria brunetti]
MLFRSGFRHGAAVQAAGLLLALLVLLPLLPVAVLLLTREQRQLNEQQQQQQQQQHGVDLAAAGVRPLEGPLSLHPVPRQQQQAGSAEAEALPVYLLGQQVQEERRDLHQPENQLHQKYGHPLWHLLKGEATSGPEKPQHQQQQQRQQREEGPNGWIRHGLLAERPEDTTPHRVAVSVAAPAAPAVPTSPVPAAAALSPILPSEYHTGVMPLALAPSPPAAAPGDPPAAAAVGATPAVARETSASASPPGEHAAITAAPPTFVHPQLQQQQQLLLQQQQQLLHGQQHWRGPTNTPLHTGTAAKPPHPSTQQVFLHRAAAAAPVVLSQFGGSATSPTRQQQQLYSQHQQPLPYLLLPPGRATVAAAAPSASSIGVEPKLQPGSSHLHIGVQQQNEVQQKLRQQTQQLQLEHSHREKKDAVAVEAATLQELDAPTEASHKIAPGAAPATAAEGEPLLPSGSVEDSKRVADVPAAETGALAVEDEQKRGVSAVATWKPRVAVDRVSESAAAPATATATAGEAFAPALSNDTRPDASVMDEAAGFSEGDLGPAISVEERLNEAAGVADSGTHRSGKEEDNTQFGIDGNPEEAADGEEPYAVGPKTDELRSATNLEMLAEGQLIQTENGTEDTTHEGVAMKLQTDDGCRRKREEEDAGSDKDEGSDRNDESENLFPHFRGCNSSSKASSGSSSIEDSDSLQVHWLDSDISSREADLQRVDTSAAERPQHDDNQWENAQLQQQQQHMPPTTCTGSNLGNSVDSEALTASGSTLPLAAPVSDAESSPAAGPATAAVPVAALSHSHVVDASAILTGQDMGRQVLLHPTEDPALVLLVQQQLQQQAQQQVLQPLQQPLQHTLQQPLPPLPQPLQPDLQQQLGDSSSLLTPQELIKQQQLQLQQQQAMVQQLQQQVAMQQDLLLRAQEQQLQQTQHQRMQQQQQQLLHMQLAHVSEKQQVQGALLQHHLHQLQQQQLHQQKVLQLQQRQPLHSQAQVL